MCQCRPSKQPVSMKIEQSLRRCLSEGISSIVPGIDLTRLHRPYCTLATAILENDKECLGV